MALPYGTTGSLCPSFLPVRLVGLSVKHPYTITLCDRLPIGLRVPLEASVTLLEATTPVKLPTKQCPPPWSQSSNNQRAVFQGRLHEYWRTHFNVSGLSYTSITQTQC